MSLCLETYRMLRVEILVDTTCGNTQIAITQYRSSNKQSVLCVEILFDVTCGNIDRNPFTVLLQMKERVLYVETVTVKRVMHYVWKHSFSYFNQDKLC